VISNVQYVEPGYFVFGIGRAGFPSWPSINRPPPSLRRTVYRKRRPSRFRRQRSRCAHRRALLRVVLRNWWVGELV